MTEDKKTLVLADSRPAPEALALIPSLVEIEDSEDRERFLQEHDTLHDPAVVLRLTQDALRLAREDLHRAERVVESASWLAELLNDDFCRARSLRAQGHILYLTTHHHQAVKSYEAAFRIFDRLGNEIESAITLSGALQPLSYIGRYQDAFDAAQRARTIFEHRGDRLRLARLESNIGNILYRQDRFAEALEAYQRAQAALEGSGDAQDVAAVLLNLAVCYISLDEFAKSLEAYQNLKEYCKSHPLPLIVAQADYNIAYLHYLRGEYTQAIELYRATRRHCEEVGDAYHRALCDLDQSDLYLELNLLEEGIQQAESAFGRFEALGMGYEAAKALANLAVAAFQQGDARRALELFVNARERFTAEHNWVWPSLIDFYVALILRWQGNLPEARRKCEEALAFFARTSLTGKTVLCHLLLARIDLASKNVEAARTECLRAVGLLDRFISPSIRFHAYFTLGQVEEARTHRAEAYRSYAEAQAALEKLGSRLRGEELKIPFTGDRLSVYESLVALGLRGQIKDEHVEAAFLYMEQAKSRRLADLIAFRAHALPVPTASGSPLVEQVRDLHQELSWDYRRMQAHETAAQEHSEKQLEALRERVRHHEEQLLKALAELRQTNAEFASLQDAATTPLPLIQNRISNDTMLLEYFIARDKVCCGCVSGKSLDFVPLSTVPAVQGLAQAWQEHLAAQEGSSQDAALKILGELYDLLIRPLAAHLQARRIVIVPDKFLHQLPFHAFFDGEKHLIDKLAVSYSPSASVYYLCSTKASNRQPYSLVLGIPDEGRSTILAEAQAAAASLPKARLFVGEEANEHCLRENGPASRFVHIATSSFFRQDNPMFSFLKLGNSQLSVCDFYQRAFSCELVGITGCGSSFSATPDGEIQMGLVRGIFYAGAASALLTLWDVASDSASEFLKLFYSKLTDAPDKSVAMQQSIQGLRMHYPNPYHWAPYILLGKTG